MISVVPFISVAAVLAGYALCSMAILQLGRLVLRALGLADEPMVPGERLALAWLLGAAAFSLAVLLLAAAHLIHLWCLATLGAASVAAGLFVKRSPPAAARFSTVERIAAVAALAFLAVYFVAAMAPSPDSDGYRYHLGFPHLYRAAGGLIPIRVDFYSAFPQGMEMLFLFALHFGGFSVANLLHWNFLLALAAAIWATGSHQGAREQAACAAAALIASSVVGTTTANASVDLALAAAVWISFHCWLRWLDQPRRGWLLLAAISAGFACAVKYTGVTALLLSALFLIAARRRLAIGDFAAASVAAGVCFLPWLIRNWVYFRNPVYPFLNAWFPNPHLLPSSEAAWVANLRNFNGAAIDFSYPWEAAVRGVTPLGFTGPFFLLVPFALLALRHRFGCWLLAGAAVTSLPWLFGNPIVRFAIPALPFLALGIALGLTVFPGRLGRGILAAALLVHALMDFPLFIERWNKQWIVALKEIPWRRALRLENPPDYWRRALPSYPVLEYVEAGTPPAARIIAFDEQYQFFTTRLLANPYASEQSSYAVEVLHRAADRGSWPLRSCTVELLPNELRGLRLVQKQQDRYAPWTLFEIGLPNRESAGLNAEPNPWDAPLAADGDIVTAWSSKQPRRPGMWVEARWDQPQVIGRLQYSTSPNGEGRIELQGSHGGASWDALPGRTRCEDVTVAHFERRSTGEISKKGWTHLLANRGHFWLEQALQHPDRWGLRLLFTNGPVCLLEAPSPNPP